VTHRSTFENRHVARRSYANHFVNLISEGSKFDRRATLEWEVDFVEGRINPSVRIWVLEALADHPKLCPLHVISRLEAVCLQPAKLSSKGGCSPNGWFQETENLR
jgi:hypothetical protein